MKEQETLSDKIEEYGNTSYIYTDFVKEFINWVLGDIEGGYEGVELINRIRNKAGDKLT